MDFRFTEDQQLFAETVRDILIGECPPSAVRQTWETGTGTVPGLWETLAGTGVVGMTAPESHGGLGMAETDLVLLMEELGRAACPEIILEHTAVAIPLLAEAGSAELQEKWLSAAASGEAKISVSLGSPYVLGADQADLLILEHEGSLHALEASDVSLQAQSSVDETRRLFSVDWTPSDANVLTANPSVVDRAGYRASLAAAAQCVGIGQQLLDLTVEYVQERMQFGKPVGVNQAVKHHLANTGLALEFARPMVYRAAWATANGTTDAGEAVAGAKMLASDAVDLACRTSLQCHGAIAYTVEYDLQLWLKRGWALAAAWGGSSQQADRIADLLGI